MSRLLLQILVVLAFDARAQAACGPPTPRDAEGPFYKAGAPARESLLEPGTRADTLLLSGRVLSKDCKPVPHARLDFWQADEKGEYDNAGYRYRGVVTADGEGRYRLQTVLPGLYPGRPRHIHVKVSPPGGRTLTTQIYFPDAGARRAEFDFVLQ